MIRARGFCGACLLLFVACVSHLMMSTQSEWFNESGNLVLIDHSAALRRWRLGTKFARGGFRPCTAPASKSQIAQHGVPRVQRSLSHAAETVAWCAMTLFNGPRITPRAMHFRSFSLIFVLGSLQRSSFCRVPAFRVRSLQ